MKLFGKPYTLKHATWTFIIIVWGSFLIFGYYDRADPLVFHGSASSTIPSGSYGDEIMFDYYVDRNLSRKCSMVLQRYTVDSTHAKRRYAEDDDFVSAEGREEREHDFPGRLRIPITIPKLPPGRSKLLTESQWRCPRNLTTYVIPITMSYAWEFDVRPAEKTAPRQTGGSP